VFLNGRPVEDAVISRALAEGFKGAVAEGLHPAAWLWIDMEPTLVDVNVHPAKREVRFHRPMDLREAILEAVTGGLKPSVPAPPVLRNPQGFQQAAGTFEPTTPPGRSPVPIPPAAQPLPMPDPGRVLRTPQAELTDWRPTSDELPPPANEAAAIRKAPEFRIIGMLKHRFVILESDEGLVLFDPKAARERIFYEDLLRQKGSHIATQGLLVPVLLEFDPRDADLLLRERLALAAAGIELESFGGNTIQVRSLPEALGVSDPRTFLGGLLDELLHDPASGARFAFERLARTLARRAAQASECRLVEARPLLESLFRCELPYCAADGRPTLTQFGMAEIERRFGIGKC
jgi:DNA mismatch repair protein MutL